ncbi:toxin C-terminal domain-containing protein [Amycolatopsis melonis]|uniref:toxin C-terminal domain-containing protein n=1 Tax=Amycolatopsis melonis TaxID=3156488 RepID=UPI003D6CD5BE
MPAGDVDIRRLQPPDEDRGRHPGEGRRAPGDLRVLDGGEPAPGTGPVLTREQSDQVAGALGYQPTKFRTAGNAKSWMNKKAPASERYITWDRTGHRRGIFKGARLPMRSRRPAATAGAGRMISVIRAPRGRS